MTRIGVISDTHLRDAGLELAQRVKAAWGPVDMILHAGDLVGLEILESLAPPEVVAVAGNMDPSAVHTALPKKRVITVEGHRIGLIHGWGAPIGLSSRVGGEFEDVEVIVFGHSHRPSNKMLGGVLFFNPGSASLSRWGAPTVGLLKISDSIAGEIIKI
jgi:putative phosphoesterase